MRRRITERMFWGKASLQEAYAVGCRGAPKHWQPRPMPPITWWLFIGKDMAHHDLSDANISLFSSDLSLPEGAGGRGPQFTGTWFAFSHFTLNFFYYFAKKILKLYHNPKVSQFEGCRLQYVQMVNKTSTFKTKLISGNTEARRVNCNTLWCVTFPRSKQQASRY